VVGKNYPSCTIIKQMDLLKYLERIYYSKEINLNVGVIDGLQYSQLITVSHENINIQTKVDLDIYINNYAFTRMD
jgi:arylamine N-acetyltransferase